MMPKYTYEQLIEKVVKAKLWFESQRRAHDDRCMFNEDPDYYGPCTCGASKHNELLDDVLAELEL